MSTKHVKKGANRAGAMDKYARASQKSRMLPPRTEEAKQARSREIAEARERLAAARAQDVQNQSERFSDPIYADAVEFRVAAEAAGWFTTFTTGWLGIGRSITVVANRGDERLVLTWLEGEPYRVPLLTDALGRNVRLADVAQALAAL